jgi:predicted nuclease of restriction endonuclease-like (RecB) superfamily
MQIEPTKYNDFIKQLKQKIQTSQIKASIRVNEELLKLYWDMAQMIIAKQKESSWGDSIIQKISRDLQEEFPNIKGFSVTNIKYMRNWYLFWNDSNRPQVVDEIFKIPWGHNREIITKLKETQEAIYYVKQTLHYGWSRAVLVHQIESRLYHREGKAITNFETKLPPPQSDLAKATLKDPYNFDFLSMSKKYNERELEDALIEHISHFLLELGSGFAFVGRQYQLVVGGDEFFVDLLFYHIRLKCYVVVELKTVKFKPEFAGQLNFYVSAINAELKEPNDNPTIGILICKSKNNTVVEYALNSIDNPIGVSEYELVSKLPTEFKSTLPTIEEIEAELKNIGEKR